ncbi:hypothetical protein OAS14_03955 [Alphaproteobacteria bacterium]|nr:hypothetical protein [Alphaproteobacteria bacterium]
MRKVCRIFVSLVAVFLLPSCVVNPKHGLKTKADTSKFQWEEKNGDAALPLAAAKDFCSKEATDESAKIAAVLLLDKKRMVGSTVQALDPDALDTVKASEMSKCMSGLGYRTNGL